MSVKISVHAQIEGKIYEGEVTLRQVNEGESKSESPKKTSIEDLKMMFPEDLENLLAFQDKGDHIRIEPRQFLGSDNFAKIAVIIRGIGGEYVSAGKQSHFRVP